MVIGCSLQIPAKNLPAYPRIKAPRTPLAVAGRVRALRLWRDGKAKKIGIDPALICTKSLISTIAMQKPNSLANLTKIEEMKIWQRKEFGRDILDVLKQVH